jgi:hypothetical protein
MALHRVRGRGDVCGGSTMMTGAGILNRGQRGSRKGLGVGLGLLETQRRHDEEKMKCI